MGFTKYILCVLIFFAMQHETARAQITQDSLFYTGSPRNGCGTPSFTFTDSIKGSRPSGGNGTYTYTWATFDGVTFTPIAGVTTQSYKPSAPLTPAQSIIYIRITHSGALIDSASIRFTEISTLSQTISTSASTNVACGSANYPTGVMDGISTTDASSSQFVWYASVDSGKTYNTVATTKGFSTTISKTTWFFRVIVYDFNCPLSSNILKFTFTTPSPNSISPPSNASSCNNVGTFTPGLITDAGNPGGSYTYQWESDISSNFSSPTNLGANTLDYQPAALSTTTYFRRKATSGTCTGYSNTVTISVTPAFTANTITGGQSITTGQVPGPLNGNPVTAGSNLVNYQWEESTDGGATYVAAAGTSTQQNYSPPALTRTTFYHRLASSGSCSAAVSNVDTIKVAGACSSGLSADAVITISKQPGSRTAGATYDYTLAVSNAGPDPATGMIVRDTLIGSAKFITSYPPTAGSASWDAVKKILTWNVGTVTGTIQTIVFTVQATSNDQIINAAGVTASECDPNKKNNNQRDTINDPLKTLDPKNIPDIITPNGDGLNDAFVIKGLLGVKDFQNNELVILDRWGNTVYDVKGYKNNWDGKGLSVGTYFYVLRIDNGSKLQTFKGYITLLR